MVLLPVPGFPISKKLVPPVPATSLGMSKALEVARNNAKDTWLPLVRNALESSCWLMAKPL
jgi:hypothetical protein